MALKGQWETNGGVGGVGVLSEGGDPDTIRSTSVTSSFSVVPSTISSRTPHLSISNLSRVERETLVRARRRETASLLAPLLKWLASVLLCLALLFTLVASKFSLIALAGRLNVTDDVIQDETQDSQGKKVLNQERVGRTRVWSMLLVLLLVPSAFNFLRAVWVTSFRTDKPWPPRRNWLWALLASFLESFGLTLFCLKVIPTCDAVTSLLLMTSVAAGPTAAQLIEGCRSGVNGQSKLWIVARVVGLLCLMGTFGIAMVVLVDTSTASRPSLWHAPAAVLALTLAWLPTLTRRVVRPIEINREVEVGLDIPEATMNLLTSAQSHPSSRSQSQNLSSALPSTESLGLGACTPPRIPTNQRVEIGVTWRAAIVLLGMKLVWTPVLAFLLFYVDFPIYPRGEWFNQTMTKEFVAAWSWGWEEEARLCLTLVCCGLLTYLLALWACQLCVARAALFLPVVLATVLEGVLLVAPQSCDWLFGLAFADVHSSNYCSSADSSYLPLLIGGVALACLGQVLTQGRQLYRNSSIVLQQEEQVFWVPTYNVVSLEQWLPINRRSRDDPVDQPREKAKRTRVYICTTMYRESAKEMRQLLESLSRINLAQQEGRRFFESHIFFDNGVHKSSITEFALQLLTLLKDTLGVEVNECTKVKTPYGLKLSWRLPGQSAGGMTFNIHLKDNLKVKNKKRWSQVMYMSYVLDFLCSGEELEESYILTTDADVVFDTDSVEALLDLMSRDAEVGAVCARTHPLGGGPLVWYQVFEYAIGHWFQKAAEHILGSVLCAPGCFSVYRCQALRDVLPTYASNVDEAFDFLTKDMGEDRWLCTLMVQSGWRIDYCAAASNSTFCPEEFEEFYKQRRRWIASTLANLMSLISQWRHISLLNPRVSILFKFYQVALLFSTLIGPSTVILFVSGGLSYAWTMSPVTTVILQVLVCVGFALVCLYTSQKSQLMVAKLITFLYAVTMTAVVVGTAEQVVEDFNRDNTTEIASGNVNEALPVSVTTLYLGGLIAIFILAGLLHLNELACLPQGIWYLLCLPSGYLVLNIYSIANLTDRSWGTREESTESSVQQEPWHSRLKSFLQEVFFCCKWDKGGGDPPAPPALAPFPPPLPERRISVLEDKQEPDLHPEVKDTAAGHQDGEQAQGGAEAKPDVTSPPEGVTSAAADVADEMEDDEEVILPVEEWLPSEFMAEYAPLFRRHGFDNTLFIAGMNERELRDIGVKVKAHVQYLLEEIKQLPPFHIEYEVPADATEWLRNIGLSCYIGNFKKNRIRTPREMEILKSYSRKEIKSELKISKDGHIKRLQHAIRRLRNPTQAEKNAAEIRSVVEAQVVHSLEGVSPDENDFWERLCNVSLKPELKAFGLEGELKGKLGGLRNSWLLILAVTNTLWLILITTLASKSDLVLLGANPLGLAFLIIFGVLFVVQFLCMIVHRALTLAHFLSRAPYRPGRLRRAGWAWSDADLRESKERWEDTEDVNAVRSVRWADVRAKERTKQRRKRQKKDVISAATAGHSATIDETDETSPLIPHHGQQPASSYSNASSSLTQPDSAYSSAAS